MGFCKACWKLTATDLAWLDEMLRSGKRMPKGTTRRLGVSRWVLYRHRRHPPGYSKLWRYAVPTWQAGMRVLWPRRWKPGQSGGGNRKGYPDKKPRAPSGTGVWAALQAERAERREAWEREQAATAARSYGGE